MTAPAPDTAASEIFTPSLVAGLDLLTGRERDADLVARQIGAPLRDRGALDVTVATHAARLGELRHVALSIGWAGLELGLARDVLRCWRSPGADAAAGAAAAVGAAGEGGLLIGGSYTGPAELRDPTEVAAAAHTCRDSGRVVVFPGSDQLTGTMPVEEVLACSAIDRIVVLAGGDADPRNMLVTRDFIRAPLGGRRARPRHPASSRRHPGAVRNAVAHAVLRRPHLTLTQGNLRAPSSSVW